MPPTFDVDPEPIYVFEIEEVYLFKQYFERSDLFEELSEYYNEAEYRFEVPPSEYILNISRPLLDCSKN